MRTAIICLKEHGFSHDEIFQASWTFTNQADATHDISVAPLAGLVGRDAE